MKKVMCPECGVVMAPESVRKIREVVIRGETFRVESDMPECSSCGSGFIMKGITNDPYTLAYELYRKRHNFLSPADIRNIREAYMLSQKSFSRLLGWGEITIHKYEKGALQDDAHDEVLKLIKDPENMKSLYDSKLKGNLAPGEEKTFTEALNNILGKVNPYERVLGLKFDYPADVFNGNRPFDIERISNLVLYFLKCSVKNHLFEVPLVKCLFYSDFLNYKARKISLTGLRYANAPMGPVPDDYSVIFEYLKAEKLVNMEVITFQDSEGHKYTANAEPDTDMFSNSEKKMIDEICSKLTPLTAAEISEKTHKEVEGWIKTNSGELISYDYAHRIQAV